MQDFSVLVPSVVSTASCAGAAGEALEQQWRALRAEVDALLGGGWSGAAAAMFDRAFAEWDTGARRVVAALGKLAESLAATARAYSASDVDGAEQFARLRL